MSDPTELHDPASTQPSELSVPATRELATRDRHIAELQAQLRAQARSIHELRMQLHAARDVLEQRNGLILRLEAEVASSAVMLAGTGSSERQHISGGSPQQQGLGDESHWLLQAVGEGGGAEHLLGRRTTIGRTPDNDLSIDVDCISRHHAVILRSGSRCVIEDLNSTNGTYVNGVRINRQALEAGDRVTLGKAEFQFLTRAAVP